MQNYITIIAPQFRDFQLRIIVQICLQCKSYILHIEISQLENTQNLYKTKFFIHVIFTFLNPQILHKDIFFNFNMDSIEILLYWKFYGIPWIMIWMLGLCPTILLYEKIVIFRLNKISWCGNNLNFHFNPIVITFTFEFPSKTTSSTMFFPTCTIIITIWWFNVVTIIMMVALKLLSSLM